jgi:hypothetical protein
VKDYIRQWRAALKAANLLPGLLPYDLRRSALRNMIRGGTDIAVAMRISGHRTRSTFDRYNIVSTDDFRAAVNRTAAYVASLPVERNVVAMMPCSDNKHGQNTDSGSSTASSGLFGSGTYGPAMAEAGGNRTQEAPPSKEQQRKLESEDSEV